eukprot:5993865-Prymnesium_polylepis.1
MGSRRRGKRSPLVRVPPLQARAAPRTCVIPSCTRSGHHSAGARPRGTRRRCPCPAPRRNSNRSAASRRRARAGYRPRSARAPRGEARLRGAAAAAAERLLD